MKKVVSSLVLKKFMAMLCVLCFSLMLPFSVMGVSTDAKTNPLGYMEDCIDNGGVSTQGDVIKTDTKYTKEGGGTYSYKDLVDDGYVNGNFTQLTSKDKERLLSDMMKVSDAAIAKNDAITEDTKTNWLTNLQTKDGVGTQLMNTLLQNTKPDYATANRIYAPFSGLVGTILALIAIVMMAALGLLMALDLSYIGITPFRLLFPEEGGKPKIISYEAYTAVQEAEGGGGGSGQNGSGKKVAVGIYFKRRVIMLIILGICLLYLISGNIYTLVSWVLDLVSGFVGF